MVVVLAAESTTLAQTQPSRPAQQAQPADFSPAAIPSDDHQPLRAPGDDQHRRTRNGLVLGAGFGGGGFAHSCFPYCDWSTYSAYVNVGGMLTPNLALVFDLWRNFRFDVPLSQTFWTAAVRFWPTDFLWAQAGVGVAQVSVPADTEGPLLDTTVLGVAGSTGLEFWLIRSLAIDLGLRFGVGYSARFSLGSYAFLLGLSWY
jgi:hypothetical protein